MDRTSTVEAGRQAHRRFSWADAVDALEMADSDEPLPPADLELLADAQWWSGHPDASVDSLERAYAGHIEVGATAQAVEAAILLAYRAMRRLEFSVGQGWRARAERILDESEGTSRTAHPGLKLLEVADALLGRHDLDAAIRLADEGLALARGQGRRDLESLLIAFKGEALTQGGRWEEGLALVDEATAAALSGEIDLRSASDVYCATISACRNVGDFRRAGEWTEAADRWMRRHSIGGYQGICRVHRAELKRLRGAWPEAEQEARGACTELERFSLLDGVGYAYAEIGEIHRRMGDLTGADDAFASSYEFGLEPQPGMALLMLARGDADGAAASLERALTDGQANLGEMKDLLWRVTLLPAMVEVSLARGDLETAETSAAELRSISAHYGRPAFEADSVAADGAIAFARGDYPVAADALRRAWRLWRELGFPYEAARARTLLGRCVAAQGDESAARMEWTSARSVFERLGAARDLAEVDSLLYDHAPGPSGERVTKTFVFTDIVTSTDLLSLIGDAAWGELLRWHDRELQSIIAANRGEVVNHTGDGFFASFDDAGKAIGASVSIQRRLAEHRREHGFSPAVRIGVHTAEATRDGQAYIGMGVHVAARIGAVGKADEIVVSSSTLETAERAHSASDSRLVELKGVGEPVSVVSIDWH